MWTSPELSEAGPGRTIARNAVAVFLVAIFLLTILLPYRLAAAVSAALAALYAVVHLLAARRRVTRDPWPPSDDETVH